MKTLSSLLSATSEIKTNDKKGLQEKDEISLVKRFTGILYV
jgi:hypothetical protein